MIGRWDGNATMGDTMATRAGAYSSRPLHGSHLFPIVFRPIILEEFVREAAVSASEFFIREFLSDGAYPLHRREPFLGSSSIYLIYVYPVAIYFVFIYNTRTTLDDHGYPELHLGITMGDLHLSTSSTCAGIFCAARS